MTLTETLANDAWVEVLTAIRDVPGWRYKVTTKNHLVVHGPKDANFTFGSQPKGSGRTSGNVARDVEKIRTLTDEWRESSHGQARLKATAEADEAANALEVLGASLLKMDKIDVPEISAQVVVVTPLIADAWLNVNTANRPIRKHRVSKYVNEMLKGLWQLTGEPIKFDAEGHLIDGQHRLKAVVQSGCTVQMLVVRGVSRQAFAVMDSGMTRTVADAVGDIKYRSKVPAIARCVMLWESGVPMRTQSLTITRSEVVAWVETHYDETAELIRRTGIVIREVDINLSALAALGFVVEHGHGPEARVQFDQFLLDLSLGVGLKEGSAVHALRRYCRRRRTMPYNSIEFEAFTYAQAWNAFVLQEPISGLISQWKMTSPRPVVLFP